MLKKIQKPVIIQFLDHVPVFTLTLDRLFLLTFPLLLPCYSPLTLRCSSVTVTQWVVVTHIVNPSHFYVRYVAEKREIEALSKKINNLCARDSCHFASSDTLETGVFIFNVCTITVM